jgi:Bacterial Ig-like domain (group 3)/FG-GAP-like repeat/FG-GAP repeat
MKLFCSCGLRSLMRVVLPLLAVLLPGTMMLAQTATTTALAVSPTSSPGSPLAPKIVVTLTATVTAAGATPVHPGLVTFCDATPCKGLAIVGTAQLTSAGTAVLRFIPGGGSHSYHAVFAGTTTYATSSSTPQAVTVSSPPLFPTTAGIAASGSAGNYTLTAIVVGIGRATLAPTGSVSFIDTTNGNSVLGTATLGPATLGRFPNAPGSPVAVGNTPRAVAVGDFNGDGIADLAVTNYSSNTVSILLGNLSGDFTPASGSPIAVGIQPFGVAVGDFNGDGIADLAVANYGSNTVSVLLGNGSGGFAPALGSPIAVGTQPLAVAVGDFNGDGIADLAVANYGAATVSILLGGGRGGFTLGSAPAVGTTPYALAVGDFNGDGIADLAVVNSVPHNVSILLGTGSGGFAPAPGSPIAVGTSPRAVTVGDFNGDGIADLAVVNAGPNNVSILLGTGSGGFAPAPGSPITVGKLPRALAVGDFNDDGIADLAVASSGSNKVFILLGNGRGGFSGAPGSPIVVGNTPYAVAVGDFDGDGIADLAVTNSGTANVSILLNQVTHTATAVLTAVSVPGSGTMHAVDATYAGDSNFAGSTSPTISLTSTPVTGGPVATTTSLVLSTASTVAFGTPVTLTANVRPNTSNGATATGIMSFNDGATLLGTAPISSTGAASITVSTFAVGSHTLTAVYGGDTNFLTSTSSPVSLIVGTSQAVTTYHYDNLRTGWNSNETLLTPSNVNSTTFGLLQSVTLDEQVDAQPLIVPSENITAGSLQGVHDVVYVATANNTIYAIDASTGVVLLNPNFGPPIPKPLNCGNNAPVVGITGTPVIDLASNSMYVIVYTLGNPNTNFLPAVPTYTIHELDLGNLKDRVVPVVVAGSHTLTNGTTYNFNAKVQRQRPGLLEANGNIYAGFGSFCDFAVTLSRGWVLGWQMGTLAPLSGNNLNDTQTSPQSSFYLSAIWMSGYGLAGDASGNIYFVTGNSDRNNNVYDGVTDIQESVVKLAPNLSMSSIFTPADEFFLDQHDKDFGAGGVLLLPTQGGSIPNLAAAAGKEGNLFLLNQAALGGFSPTNSGIVGEVGIGGCFCGQSYFSSGVPHIVSSGGRTVNLWNLATSPSVTLTKAGSQTITSAQLNGFFTSVSSSGSNNAIIWAVSGPQSATNTGVLLYAMNAQPSTGLHPVLPILFSAVAGSWTNLGGNANIVPVVANGHVYVASDKGLTIFGLLGISASRKTITPAPVTENVPTKKNPREIYGTITSIINASHVTIKTRKGRLLNVDASVAIQNEQCIGLEVGEHVDVQGAIDANGVFQANTIQRAKDSDQLWPKDI